jgi:hypothetical protein
MIGAVSHRMILPIDRHPLRFAAVVLCLWTLVALRAIAQPAPDTPETARPVVPGIAPDAPPAPAHASLPTPDDTTDADSTPKRAVDESIGVIDSTHAGEPPRLTQAEYQFAGQPRYTMNGELPYRETNIKPATLASFGGALLVLAGSITWYQQAWYPDSTKAPFHFQTDWGYSKQFDKAGHMFGGWMSSYCSYEAFIASGFDRDDAALWGSLGGLFFQTVMEVQDGFFSYGFDPTDAISNAIGSGYFYAQQKIPVLQYFSPKWSVGPNPRDSAREASQIRSRLIVDDYDRQDVWLSAKMHYLLPDAWKPYWPKWLCLAVGAGARDVELIGYQPYRELHFALDYDLVEMLPDLGSFGNWLVQSLNNFKLLPAPALQVWPHVQFKLLYPFKL